MVELVERRAQDASNAPPDEDAPTFRTAPPRDAVERSWAELAPESARELAAAPPEGNGDAANGAMLACTFVAGLLAGTLLLAPLTGSPFAGAAGAGSGAGEVPTEVVPTALVAPIVAEGFAVLDADPQAAAARFRAALELDPGDPTAALGLGTALVTVGEVADAQPWLCVASRAGGVLGVSAEGLLSAHRMSCP